MNTAVLARNTTSYAMHHTTGAPRLAVLFSFGNHATFHRTMTFKTHVVPVLQKHFVPAYFVCGTTEHAAYDRRVFTQVNVSDIHYKHMTDECDYDEEARASNDRALSHFANSCRNQSIANKAHVVAMAQFHRLHACFAYAQRVGRQRLRPRGDGRGDYPGNEPFEWYLRTRPDLVWYQPFRVDAVLQDPKEPIALRAARASGMELRLGQLAKDFYFVGPDDCNEVPSAFKCTTFDDQFALVPRKYATSFFSFPYEWRRLRYADDADTGTCRMGACVWKFDKSCPEHVLTRYVRRLDLATELLVVPATLDWRVISKVATRPFNPDTMLSCPLASDVWGTTAWLLSRGLMPWLRGPHDLPRGVSNWTRTAFAKEEMSAKIVDAFAQRLRSAIAEDRSLYGL